PVALRPSLTTGLPLSRRRLVATCLAYFARRVPNGAGPCGEMLSMPWGRWRQFLANVCASIRLFLSGASKSRRFLYAVEFNQRTGEGDRRGKNPHEITPPWAAFRWSRAGAAT